MCLALAERGTDRQADDVAAEMDFAAETAARATKRLVLTPPFSPAAQRCARTVVLSIICSMSNSPPLSASACKTMSHTPERHQRRNCLCTEFQLPNSSGMSRHGAPVRQTQSAPSSTRRWSEGGRPPREDGLVKKRWIIAHSSSLIRPRITANPSKPSSRCRITPFRVGGIHQLAKDTTRIADRLRRFFSSCRRAGRDSFVAGGVPGPSTAYGQTAYVRGLSTGPSLWAHLFCFEATPYKLYMLPGLLPLSQ